MSNLFNIITSLIEITKNQHLNLIILFTIGLISFLVAFGIVGAIFETLGIFPSSIMSDVHWAIRLAVFLLLSFFAIVLVKFVAFIINLDWWIHLVLILLIVSGFLIVFFTRRNSSIRSSSQLSRNGKED